MRLYFGTAHLLLAVGFACGCVAGWWLTRLYFVRALQRIEDRVGSLRRNITAEVRGDTVTVGTRQRYSDTQELGGHIPRSKQ